jgi:hypothetical protein
VRLLRRSQTHRPRRQAQRLAAACALVSCLVATSGDAALSPPAVIAIVPSAAGPRLKPLDARTLAPLRGGWSHAVGTQQSSASGKESAWAALSPSRSRIAFTGRGGWVTVLDTASGRIVRKYGADAGDGLYWVGGDGTRNSADGVLIAALFGCWSLGCGLELTIPGTNLAIAGISGRFATVSKGALVLAEGTTRLHIYGRAVEEVVELTRMPGHAPFRVVADIAHERLFAITSAGLVAEIDRIARTPRVRYHRVDLNGRPFEAAWAGSGQIALWGQDGLGAIDVRTWRTRAVASGVTGALATPYGLAAWADDSPDGLAVYRPDGTRRLRVLVGKRVLAAVAVGDYLYAHVGAGGRYSINLSTGKVAGPLPNDSTIVTPTLVAIP